MRSVTDIAQSVLDEMDLTICVETVTSLGNNQWRLSVCECTDTLHAIAGRTISKSGTDYSIVSVVHDESIVISSATQPATGTWTLPKPNYWHGTPMQVSAEMAKVQNDITRFPMVWLLEVLSEDRTNQYNPVSSIEVTPDARFFILDYADFKNGTSESLHEDVVKPMQNFANRYIDEGYRLGYWDKPTRAIYYPWSKFGLNYTNPKTADRFSSLSKILPDDCGGVELRLTVDCYKKIRR